MHIEKKKKIKKDRKNAQKHIKRERNERKNTHMHIKEQENEKEIHTGI